MDAKAEVRTIRLTCPICVKEGRTETIEVSSEFARVPALLKRWVPKWAQEKGFISLEEAVAKDPSFAALIVKINGRNEATVLCVQHGFALRAAKIWTEKLSVIQERQAKAAARKATEAFGSIASILAGKQNRSATEPQVVEPEEDSASVRAKKEQEDVQRRLTASAKTKADKDANEGKERRPTKNPRKTRRSRRDQEEDEG